MRFTNEPDEESARSCMPAYHTFDAFSPDWDALGATEMFALFMSQGDCQILLDAVNDDLDYHRTRQKLSSMSVVFGTLLAIIIAIFVVFAGVAIQILVLLVHVIATRWLRERCSEKVSDFLANDVNPAIHVRGVAFEFKALSEGCATASFELVVVKLPHYAAVQRERRLRGGQSIQPLSETDVSAELAVEVGEGASSPHREQSSRSRTEDHDDDFSAIVVGMPLSMESGTLSREVSDSQCFTPLRRHRPS